jgi:hypothetical protein
MADNSTVKITIDVIDANSGQVVSTITKNLQGMGDAGKSAGEKIAAGADQGRDALNDVGAAGEAAGKKISKGMGDAGAHTLTNLDYVRQLRDDLGIRIPRSMEKVISQSALASQAIGMLGSALIGLGAVEIFARMGMAAYEFYKRISDVTEAVQKYAVAAAQAGQQKLFDTASLETARALISQTADDLDALEKKRKLAGVGQDGKGSVLQYINYGLDNDFHAYTKTDDKKAAEARAQLDMARERTRLLESQGQMETLQAENATKSVGLVGAAARAAKRDAEDAIAMLKMQQAQADEQTHYQDSMKAHALALASGKKGDDLPAIYKPDPNAGVAAYGDAVRNAGDTYSAESAADARKQAEETRHIQAEAQNAGRQGEAKYMGERDEQLRLLKEKMRDTELSPIEYMKRVAAVEQQYSQERLKRLENEHAETARMQSEAASGGNTGMARVDVQTTTRLASIAKEAPGFSDPATRAAREAAARQQGQQEQQREAAAFSERLSQYEDGHADRSESANDRIEAQTKKTIAEIEKAWKEEYGGLDALDQRRVQSRQAVNEAEAKIQADAAQQIADARKTLLDQTMKVEDEGRRMGQSKEREQTQAVIDEYNERSRALDELASKDAQNADLYSRQKIAAKEIENGKLLDLERQQQEKLAGMLKGFMGKHPLEALERQGEEISGKYLSQLIGKSAAGRAATTNVVDGTMPGKHKSKMLDLGSSAPAITQAADPAKAPPVVTTSSNVSAASTTLTASTAVINVGQATFTGMGSGGGGAALPAQAMLAASGGGQHTSPAAIAAITGGAGVSASPSGTIRAAGDAGIFGAGGASFSSSAAGGNMGMLPGGDKGSTSFSADVRAAAAGTGDVSTAAPGIPGMGPDAGQNALASTQKAYGMGQSVEDLGKTLYGATGSQAADGVKKSSMMDSKLAGQIGTGVGGGIGMFSAVEGNGGFGGALSGAGAGAKLGSLAGPMGTLIGAGVGAIIGAIGFGGAQKAKEYEKKQVRPRIEADELGFGMGTIDYQSAYDDLTKLDIDARKATQAWGPGGTGEYLNRISPEIKAAMSKLTSEQKSGRAKYGMTAAQFDMGGPISGFGDMATSSTNGWIHAQQGEFVLQQQAALNHYQAAQLINGGASHSDMANYYGGSRSAGQTTQPAATSGDVNMHFHSHDPRGTMQLFMDNKHVIRKALNESYAENSGGADLG